MNENRSAAFSGAALTAAGCLLYMISGGIRHNFGILMPSLVEMTGLTYAQVSFAAAVGQLMYGLTQPFFGLLALKKSNGLVLTLGLFLMGAGLALAPLAHAQWSLLLTLGILFFSGTGAVCFGMIMGALTPLLGRERASAASGMLNAAAGIGASLLSPVMQAMVSRMGIAATLPALCAPVAALLPVTLWLTRHAPTRTDGAKQAGAGATLKAALADHDFRCLMAGFATCGFHMCIIQTHFYALALSYGLSEEAAALGYTVFGLTGMAGSVACGLLCQKFSHGTMLTALYGARAVAVAAFLWLLPKNAFSVFAFMTVLGLTGDATVTPTSEVISRKFGAAALGFLFGITFVGHQAGGFLSSWLGGLLDGSSLWTADIVLCALASLASWRIGKQAN